MKSRGMIKWNRWCSMRKGRGGGGVNYKSGIVNVTHCRQLEICDQESNLLEGIFSLLPQLLKYCYKCRF